MTKSAEKLMPQAEELANTVFIGKGENLPACIFTARYYSSWVLASEIETVLEFASTKLAELIAARLNQEAEN